MFTSFLARSFRPDHVLGLPILLALGCASPGPPRPPSLHLPAVANKLEARRVGAEVLLTFVTPADTTDGDKIRGPITAAVCREAPLENGAASQKPVVCDPLPRIKAVPGATAVIDRLPAALSTGRARLLAYKVELVNDRGRSAGSSDAVYAAAGEAPPPMGALTISARREAALIQWPPPPATSQKGTTIELKRTLIAVEGSVQPASAAGQPSAGGGRRTEARVPSFRAGKTPVDQATLTVDEGAPDTGFNRGGVLDPTVRDLETYVYVAQRVRMVTLDGHELELRGIASPPATFAYRDTFAPRPPVGLVAVASGGFEGPQPAGQPNLLSIDLSWEPNEERDLLGYNVYRREGPGPFTRLNQEPAPSPAFRDLHVAAGHAYSYRVTAIDRRNNESAPGDEIHETLKQ